MKDGNAQLKWDLDVQAGEFKPGESFLGEGKDGKQTGAIASGTDDFLVLARGMVTESGAFALATMSIDGRTGKVTPVPAMDMFKIWLLLGMQLSKMEDLDNTRRAVAFSANDMFMQLAGGEPLDFDEFMKGMPVEKKEGGA